MQFIRVFTFVSAAVLAVMLTAMTAEAADHRQLYSFTTGKPKTFCKKWKCACINYEPTNSNLTFKTAYCQPGDFSGNNKTMEALAFCSFANGTHTKLVNKHIVTALYNSTNATLVPSS